MLYFFEIKKLRVLYTYNVIHLVFVQYIWYMQLYFIIYNGQNLSGIPIFSANRIAV